MRVAADHAGLDRIFHAYDGFATKHAIPDQIRRDVYVALEEIVSNVVRHGARDRTPTISLTLAIERGAFTISITDDGPRYDPFTSAPVPDVTQALMDRPLGGLGVLFVQRLTDAHAYARRANRNCVTLQRLLEERHEPTKTRKARKHENG